MTDRDRESQDGRPPHREDHDDDRIEKRHDREPPTPGDQCEEDTLPDFDGPPDK